MSIERAVMITIELCFGGFGLIAMILLYFNRMKLHGTKSVQGLQWLMSLNVFCLLFDAGAYYFRGNTSTLGCFATRITNFVTACITILFLYLMFRTMKHHLREYEIKGVRWVEYLMLGAVIVDELGLVVTQFIPFYYAFDESNRYYRAAGFPVSLLLLLVLILVDLLYSLYGVYRVGMKEFWMWLLLTVGSILSYAVQALFYGLSYGYFTTTVIMMIIFAWYERKIGMQLIRERIRKNEIKEALLQSRIEQADASARIMLSQIGPHFVFNALACIRALVDENPETAKEAIGYFSRYLRNDIEMLETSGMVLIDQELDFTENYIYMEKLRFGDELQFGISVADDTFFEIPPLTIQPLVNNAIDHGIRARADGQGRVDVRVFSETREDGAYNIVEVEDDGVGFSEEDISEKMEHTGIRNIRERLDYMCKGSLEFESKPGKTVARIIIKATDT